MNTAKLLIPGAAPYLYLLELLKTREPGPARRGTLFFPDHSTHHLTVEQDGEAMAERLSGLPDAYQPITVCMYWRDFNLCRQAPFVNRGMRIVSAGHMYDPWFLFRLHYLCSLHRFTASNAIGSHLFYSVKAGCSFFYFAGYDRSVLGDPSHLKRDRHANSPALEEGLRSLFEFPPQPTTTARQMEAVDYYLSADQLKSADDLRAELLDAERLDRAFFIGRSTNRRRRPVFPMRYRRYVRAHMTRVRGWTKRMLSPLGRKGLAPSEL